MTIYRKRKRMAGGILLEASIALPLLLGMIFGAFDFGIMLWSQALMDDTIREAGRMAATEFALKDTTTNDLDPAVTDPIEAFLEARLNGMPFLENVDVDFDRLEDAGGGVGEFIFVDGSARFEFIFFSHLGISGMDIKSSARSRWEYTSL